MKHARRLPAWCTAGEPGGARDAPPRGVPDEPQTQTDLDLLRALRVVIDPELGIDIVSLGLVYGASREGDRARVVMTLTTPACPLGEVLVADAKAAVTTLVRGVREADIELVFTPRWSPDRMTLEAKERLGYFD